jgi:glutamate-1-semialdehyde aminotransferase
MFAPGVWPGYYEKAKGQEIWDLDGNHYFDFSIAGIGANVLGYSDDFVDQSVINRIQKGSSSSLNCPEEIELAELFQELHPWMEMFRYSRSGGEAVSIAVRIARANKKRDKIAFCGYHGWHDWYLSANIKDGSNLNSHLLPGLSPLGVPAALGGSAIPFHYNNLEELEQILRNHSGELAAIIMEPVGSYKPDDGFLSRVRELADFHDVLLIFDEISSGFRVNAGGIHSTYNVSPDIAIFSKAISNGYPMGVVAGKARVMESAQDTFISSTSWTEGIGPTAAIATITKFRDENVHDHLVKIGIMINEGWKASAEKAELEIKITGLPSLSKFSFEHPKDLLMKTYFTQEMLAVGFLASGRFYSMFSHTVEQAERYIWQTSRIFNEMSGLLSENKLESRLRGDIAHNGFKRLN